MSRIKGRVDVMCRPAGFSDDDSDGDDWWSSTRTRTLQTKRCVNPQVEFEGAVKNGNLEGVKAALMDGATVQGTDSAGYTGLMLACSYGHSHVVRYLVDQGSQTNVCTSGLIYPLMVVCFSRCEDKQRLLECAQILIKECVNVNAVDVHGTTALMFACKSGHCVLVDELVKNGANVHLLDTQQWNALHHSANVGNEAAVEILLAAGAKKGVKDARGRRPFQIALAKPSLKHLAESLCPKRLRNMLEPETDPSDMFQFQLEETAFQSFLRKMNSINEDMSKRRPDKKGEQLNLYEFLTTTEEELEALGMGFSWHRRQTLEYIRGYLLEPWERLVEPRLSKSGQAVVKWNAKKGHESVYPELTFVNSAHLLINVGKRLQIVQASAKYMEMNLNEAVVDERIQQQTKLTALNIRLLELEVEKLMRSLASHDHEPTIPADLVVGQPLDRQKTHRSKVVAVVSILAFALWRFKGNVCLWR